MTHQSRQDEASGLTRVKVKTEKGKEGYVTLETINGAPGFDSLPFETINGEAEGLETMSAAPALTWRERVVSFWWLFGTFVAQSCALYGAHSINGSSAKPPQIMF